MKLHISGAAAIPTIGVVLIFGGPTSLSVGLAIPGTASHENRTGQNHGEATKTPTNGRPRHHHPHNDKREYEFNEESLRR